MSTTTTRCWVLKHTSGTSIGDYYEEHDGTPHFPTPESAIDYRNDRGDGDTEPVLWPFDCHSIVCRCGYEMDAEYSVEHHTRADHAEVSARDGGWTQNPDGSWRCPTCA